MSSGAHLIAAERKRQQTDEGYDAYHDEDHIGGEMVTAAIVYQRCALTNYAPDNAHAAAPMPTPPADWPWEDEWFKPTWSDPVRNLVKAGALIAAEIDRLQRTALDTETGSSAQDRERAPSAGKSGCDMSGEASPLPAPDANGGGV